MSKKCPSRLPKHLKPKPFYDRILPQLLKVLDVLSILDLFSIIRILNKSNTISNLLSHRRTEVLNADDRHRRRRRWGSRRFNWFQAIYALLLDLIDLLARLLLAFVPVLQEDGASV